MRYRIALWGAAGLLVATGWAVYFSLASKELPIQPILTALLRLTCPVAMVGLHYPVSLLQSLVANIATYVLVGLAVEAVRWERSHSN